MYLWQRFCRLSGTGRPIRLGGVPLKAMRTDDLLAHISIVFQDVYLFYDSIEGNIRMGKMDATHEEVVRAAKAAASLDPKNEVLIQQAISALVEEKTVFVIAHRLQSICNADNIIVLEDGRVAEQGDHERLFERDGLYARFWREQNQAEQWQIQS